MSGEVFISVDAGTSVVKSIAIDAASGRQIAVAAARNNYKKLPGGGCEQNLAATWRKAATTLSAVAGRVPGGARKIVAVGVTGQGDGTWLIDKEGKPVGDAMLWLDTRAADIVSGWEKSGARKEVYKFTGCGANACNQSAQLAWLKSRMPRRLKKADCAMHCKDWLYFNLTGVRATDVSEGVFTFGDCVKRRYEPEVLNILDIADCRRLLPPMLDGAKKTHPLSESVASATGLLSGTPVSLGGVDVVCTALGGGVCAPGADTGCTIIGSTGMHIKMFADVKKIPFGKIPGGYTMTVPGFRSAALRMHSNMSATLNLDWLARLMAEAAAISGAKTNVKKTLHWLDREVAKASCGNIVYLPHIEAGERGPFLNPDARAQFSGLHGDIDIGQLARAVYEGLAFAARHCYQAIGGVPKEIRMVGGAARLQTFSRIFTNALGARVRASGWQEPGAVGAAMIAASALRYFPDMRAACRAWADAELGEPQLPDPALRARYDRLFSAYLAASETAPPVWNILAKSEKKDGC